MIGALGLSRVYVVDVETTGTSNADRVIEIGIVRLERLLVDEPRIVLSTLVNPERRIDPNAARVHGISDRDVRDAPRWVDVVDDVRRELRESGTMSAYGASFDRRMICGMGLDLPPIEMWLDPLRLCKRVDAQGPHTLTAACERRRIRSGGHRAASDALATAHLLVAMLRELPVLPDTVDELIDWLAQPAKKARKVPPVRRLWRVRGGVGGSMWLKGRRWDEGPWWVISPTNAASYWSQEEANDAARWSKGTAVEVDRVAGGAA